MPTLPIKSMSLLSAGQERYLLWLTAASTMAGVALFVVAPMTAAWLLPLCVIAPLAWYWFAKGQLPTLQASPVMGWLALAAIYLVINSFWSQDFPSASFAGLALLILIGALHVTTTTLRVGEDQPLQAMALGFYAAMAIAGLFLCFEIFDDQWLRRQIMIRVPALRADVRHLTLEGGQIVALPPYLLNRSIAAWTLLLWPALHVLARLRLTQRQRWLMAAALVPGVPAIFASDHDTSKLAFLGAATIYAMYLAAPAVARGFVIAGWTAATLLVVPAAAIALSSQLYLIPWLPSSAQDRIVLWGHTSQQVSKAPILGVGINTSSVVSRGVDDANVPRAPGSSRRMSIRHHPHNAYLQIWYEAGTVGALLLFGLGILTLGSVARAPVDTRPFLYATFVTCAVMAASSFSLWQAWFMFSLGLTVVFAVLACTLRSTR